MLIFFRFNIFLFCFIFILSLYIQLTSTAKVTYQRYRLNRNISIINILRNIQNTLEILRTYTKSEIYDWWTKAWEPSHILLGVHYLVAAHTGNVGSYGTDLKLACLPLFVLHATRQGHRNNWGGLKNDSGKKEGKVSLLPRGIRVPENEQTAVAFHQLNVCVKVRLFMANNNTFNYYFTVSTKPHCVLSADIYNCSHNKIGTKIVNIDYYLSVLTGIMQ